MKHDEILEALLSLRPEGKFVLSGDDYAQIEWLSTDTKPTLKQVEDEIKLLPAKKAQVETQAQLAKANAEAKLAALGLTAEDLKALGL